MVIQKKACAGTLESSDIYVEVAPLPQGSGIKLDLNSVVYAQFGKEIEEVIMLHPNVLECAVIGVPSERSGEKVKAFIVKKHKSLTEAPHRRLSESIYRSPHH